MQVDRVRNAVLLALVAGAWLVAIGLDVRWRATRPRARELGEGSCTIPPDAASEPVRLLLCTGRMPVNCAAASELELLEGVGSVRAMAIVEHRRAHGPFERPSDLERVRGIGPVTAGRLGRQVSFARRGRACASTRP